MKIELEKDFLFVEKLKKGNHKAYTQLINNYYENLCGYANLFTKDPSKSEDIVQNVFVKLWVYRKKIDSNIPIKRYLHKSVYNEFIDQYRKNKSVISLEKKHLNAISAIIEDNSVDIEKLMIRVNKEIEKLPEKCKRVFILNKKDGLTHDEIAEYLQISKKTVEGHVTRAFKILNKKLGKKIKSILIILFDFKIITNVK
ncbi:MAG: RNA polymerase sigma-70 factor [Crocinitomicaceae bacterium TMED209]|nr:MAG: RNA polymerase sigma-70 factor [Crocinitomicaceae bacterium TMED209]|tara:strand:+ start:8369 stop:8965 length:597 start_codon:yes stop_codon:yes gene_type:complete